MASPIYIWLKDDVGQLVKGASNVQGRENSIEAVAFQHEIYMPTDKNTGGLTGVRIHAPLSYVAKVDSSLPILLDACARGKALQHGKFVFYNITPTGDEEAYYQVELDNIRISSVRTMVDDVKAIENEQKPHRVQVSMRYERIVWHYLSGNLQASDSWTQRA